MPSEAVDVDRGQFVARVAAVGGGISARRMSADRMPISRGIAPVADIPDREGDDGGPELVIRGEHPWLVSNRRAIPVLPLRGHEVSEVATQPLRHGDHPLPHGHRGNDAVDEMRSCLCHPAAIASRTDTPALARESLEVQSLLFDSEFLRPEPSVSCLLGCFADVLNGLPKKTPDFNVEPRSDDEQATQREGQSEP